MSPAVLLAASPLDSAQLVAERFGVELPYLGMQFASFVILFLVLRWALKPLLATAGERQKKIEDGLRFRDEMEARLTQTKAETEALLKRAAVEAQQIVTEARAQAKEFTERSLRETQEQSAAALAKAQQAIELERQRVLAETRSEITRLVVATAERVLRTEMGDADRARYNNAAARELANV